MKNSLRALRLARGWSQAEVAERADASRQTLNAIEGGRYAPSLPLAYRLAAIFGVACESVFHNPYRDRDEAPSAGTAAGEVGQIDPTSADPAPPRVSGRG